MIAEIIKQDDRYSYLIKITPRKGRKDKASFNIPVVDVRDGKNARKAVELTTKEINVRKGSRFLKTSFSLWGKPYN